MMRAILVCVLVLQLPFVRPAFAHLMVRDLRAVCAADQIKSDGACRAFFRGAAEWSAMVPMAPDSPVACRSAPPANEDYLSLFARYAAFPDDRQLVAMIPKSPLCLDAPGTWSNARLSHACREDVTGSCRFYIAGVLLQAGIQMRLNLQRAFCYRDDHIHVTSEFALLGDSPQALADAVLRWTGDHPSRADEPAAKDMLEVFAAAFPCREEEKRIVYDPVP
jgi:hypothetical protein